MLTKIQIAGFIGLLAMAACSDNDNEPEPNPNLVYFLVEAPLSIHTDSYVLALENETDITAARAMIEDVSLRKIVVAEITKDPKINYYRNRDLLNNKDWSWHVAKFIGFADVTIEIYDGWPQYVEDNYSSWVENTKGGGTNGVIGFWSFTVTREVDPSELE